MTSMVVRGLRALDGCPAKGRVRTRTRILDGTVLLGFSISILRPSVLLPFIACINTPELISPVNGLFLLKICPLLKYNAWGKSW